MPAVAAGIIDCRLRSGHGREGLIAPQYLFDHADAAMVAQVYDGLIHERLGRPQLARVRQEATRLVAQWEVPVRDTGDMPVQVAFRAELDFAAAAIEVEARIAGEVVAEGVGVCALAGG